MTIEQWAAMAGFAMPALIAVVNRDEWKPWVRAVIALLSSVVVGTVTALLNGEFTGTNWASAIGIAFAASQAAYAVWWKKSGITTWIEEHLNVTPKPSMTSTGPFGGSTVSVGRHAKVEEEEVVEEEKPIYVTKAVGGPLNGQDVESRFPLGFLLVDKPTNTCWVYEASSDGKTWNLKSDEETGHDMRELDKEKLREAANGLNYDVRAYDVD